MRGLVAVGFAALACLSCSPGPEVEATDVLEAYDRAAARTGWPRFRAERIPLAVTDGRRSWLLRHPSPPPAYRSAGGEGTLRVMSGVDPALEVLRPDFGSPDRHPGRVLVLGGERTAAVRADALSSPEALALRLLHLALHVHQDATGPPAPDEAIRLAHPVPDLAALHAGRLEASALRRALGAPDSRHQACWIGEALAWRHRRLRTVPETLSGYERAVEVREGTARWLVAEAADRNAVPQVPADGYPVRDLRRRAAGIGHAWAVLLADRVPGWRDSVRVAGALSPRTLLEAVAETGGGRCGLPPDEVWRARAVARAEMARAADEGADEVRALAATPGWSLSVEAPGRSPVRVVPALPARAVALADGHVLYGPDGLELEHASGRLAVDGVRALTDPLGGAPSYPSAGRVLVVGLRPPPILLEHGDTLRLSGPGLEGRFVGVSVVRDDAGRRVSVLLSPGAGR